MEDSWPTGIYLIHNSLGPCFPEGYVCTSLDLWTHSNLSVFILKAFMEA